MKLGKRGFSAVESLVAFVLVSLMAMLYLPSFYPELVRLQHAQQQAARWQLFSEVSKIQLSDTLDKESVIQQRLADYHATQNEQVLYFDCTAAVCEIIFEDGGELRVQVES